jgi:hypothetical protein
MSRIARIGKVLKFPFLIFVNKSNWCTIFSYIFISILYMFREALCPSSVDLIVLIRDLVYVTLCRWPSGMQVGMNSFRPAYQPLIYTDWHIPGVALKQLILLIMGTWLPETCREYKQTYKKKLCKIWFICEDYQTSNYTAVSAVAWPFFKYIFIGRFQNEINML